MYSYERNNKYFEGPKTKIKSNYFSLIPVGLAVLFMFLPISEVMIKVFLIFISLMMFVILWYALKKEVTVDPGIPDSEIDDQQCSFPQDEAVQMALDALGLDISQFSAIPPIVLAGGYFTGIGGDYKTRKGLDGQVRSSNTEVTVFLFSETEVFRFHYRFSLINRDEESYATDEYFYRDIVTISTRSDVIEYKSGTRNKTNLSTGKKEEEDIMSKGTIEKLVMYTTGGTSVGCAIRTNDDEIQRKILAMRALLREKKEA